MLQACTEYCFHNWSKMSKINWVVSSAWFRLLNIPAVCNIMKNLCLLKFKMWSTFHLFLNTQCLPPSRGTGLKYAPSPSNDLHMTGICGLIWQTCVLDWEKQSLHYTLTVCHYVIQGLSQSIPPLFVFSLAQVERSSIRCLTYIFTPLNFFIFYFYQLEFKWT